MTKPASPPRDWQTTIATNFEGVTWGAKPAGMCTLPDHNGPCTVCGKLWSLTYGRCFPIDQPTTTGREILAAFNAELGKWCDEWSGVTDEMRGLKTLTSPLGSYVGGLVCTGPGTIEPATSHGRASWDIQPTFTPRLGLRTP